VIYIPFVSPTGQDMFVYEGLGQLCAAGKDYWNPYRPQGFTQYVSLAFRMGLPPEAIIYMNLLMVALSVWLAGLAWNVLLPPLKSRSRLFSACKYAFIAAAHLVFMLGCAREVLADVPAACMALAAVWLFIIACGRNNAWLLALSGLALGESVTLRLFYCYPAYFLAFAAVLCCLWLKRLAPSAVVGFLLLMAYPILTQYAFIYQRLHTWTMVDEKATAFEMQEEAGCFMDNGLGPAYGVDVYRDTSLYLYRCNGCMPDGNGWSGSLQHHDFLEIAKLAWMRNDFYFGSWIPQPAIMYLSDRIFSFWIYMANWLAVLSTLSLFILMRRRWILGGALFFVFGVWGLSLYIHPESRYMVLVQAFAWTLAPLAPLAWRGRLWSMDGEAGHA
jgi:hypothetical protein